MVQQFMAEHPEIGVIMLRPSIVLGPHTRNIVSEVFRWPFSSFPWVLQVRGADPPMQFLSEEDTGEILYRAVRSEVRGVFNAAGDGTVRFSQIARLLGKKLLNLPSLERLSGDGNGVETSPRAVSRRTARHEPLRLGGR